MVSPSYSNLRNRETLLVGQGLPPRKSRFQKEGARCVVQGESTAAEDTWQNKDDLWQ
jgi:hypothetical protein